MTTLRQRLKEGGKSVLRFTVPNGSKKSYMKFNGGPWAYLYDREVQEVCDLETPQTVLIWDNYFNLDLEVEDYVGPLDKDDVP